MTTESVAPGAVTAPTATIPAVVDKLRETFKSGRTRSLEWRKQQLHALEKMMVGFVNSRPKPLAAYLFTRTKSIRERVIKEVAAGGMVINHLLFQFSTNKLPFGGVGPSGMGAYHGKFGFEQFSHRKTVMTKPTRPDVGAFIYPPYTEKAFKIARRLF
jgi:hypothetical protein